MHHHEHLDFDGLRKTGGRGNVIDGCLGSLCLDALQPHGAAVGLLANLDQRHLAKSLKSVRVLAGLIEKTKLRVFEASRACLGWSMLEVLGRCRRLMVNFLVTITHMPVHHSQN